jgi:hypothetical protein
MRYVFVNYVIIANQEQDATSYLRKKNLGFRIHEYDCEAVDAIKYIYSIASISSCFS